MKIMICISQLVKGGAERVASNLANYFVENNDVVLVSLRNYKPEYELNDKIKVINLDRKNRKNKLVKYISRIKYLNKCIKEENPDIILSFLPEPSFLVLVLKKIRKTKVIVSVRNDPKIEYKSKLYNLAMKILYPLADGFVFQTEEAQKYFNKKIQEKSVIILNSLNPEFIVEKPYVGEREKEIVSVGRLVEQKNQKILIEAFKKIYDKYHDYKLIIYGEGPLRNELENKIMELELQNSVFLPGIEKDIKNKIFKSKIFVLASKYEGLPNSLIEAMALGVPVISTDCPCGGPRYLIEDGKNGFLTEVDNTEMLAQKMDYILSNNEIIEDLSINANKIKERIAPNKINKEWENYLFSIFNKNN